MFETIKSDLWRFSSNGQPPALRNLLAGLLSQGFQAILVFRLFNWLHRHRLPGQPLRFVCERLIEITTGISIPACCSIGKGFRIHHFGGIIFHPSVVLGENCTLYHGVTIGDRGGSGRAATVGNNVLIGAGAKLIGEITVGDNCVIGANTVVTRSIPADTVVVGSPARCIARQQQDRTTESRSNSSHIPRVMDFRGTYKGGGGPDKTVLNSAAQHDPDKVNVKVVYLRQPNDQQFSIPEMARQLGVTCTVLVDRGLLDLGCLRQLLGIIRTHQVQVVHSHDDKTLLYAWLLFLLRPGLRLMHTCHSHSVMERDDFSTLRQYLAYRLRRRVLAFLMQRHHKPIITVSHDTRHRLIAAGLSHHEIVVLHNGIDLVQWQRAKGKPVLRDELSMKPDECLVGTVARITPEKDLTTFYQVAAAVARRIPAVRFVVVGDGYGDELLRARQEVEQLGLSGLIHFTGHRSDLHNVYASIDIFLMTSRTEGMPNTLLEAMAMETPSVATGVGGIPELLTPDSGGFLAEVGDVDGLSAAILNLLADPLQRQISGQACRRRVEQQFAFSSRVALMEAYYTSFAYENGPQRLHTGEEQHGTP